MLIPINKRTEQEQREMRRRAGIASGVARRKKQELKKSLQSILSCKGENGKEYGEEICLALIDKALSGDVKAFEVIRDTIGEKPINKASEKVISKGKGKLKLILLGDGLTAS